MTEQTKRKAPAPKSVNPNKTDNGAFVFADDSGNTYEVRADGVYKTAKGSTDERKLCDALEIVALTRNNESKDWGVWIRFKDIDEQTHSLVLSGGLLTQGKKLEEFLSSEGLRIPCLSGNSGKSPLVDFFNALPRTLPRALSVDQGGFASDKFDSFVFGDNVVLHLDDAEPISPTYDEVAATLVERGSLEEWQADVSIPALHSKRLMFGLCVSLSVPLLPIVGVPSSIFHFYGRSSCGKTSIQKAAASVWGGEERIYSWQATANGLEGLAKLHNNQPLILDEIGQAESSGIKAVYSMTNEKEKTRSTASGKLRKSNNWRVNFLSSGEFSLSEIREQILKGEQLGAATGELARFIGIPADAGRGLGVLDSLPEGLERDTKHAAAFIRSVSSMKATGTAGRAFLMALMKDVAKSGRADIEARLRSTIEIIEERLAEETLNASTEALENRVLERFAAVALAGELAADYGVLGWEKGDATEAVIECFKAWRESDESPAERVARVIDRILSLPDTDGANFAIYEWQGENFTCINRPNRSATGIVVVRAAPLDGLPNRADRVATLYLASQFRELCNKHGERLRNDEIIEALQKTGLLVSNQTGRRPQYQISKSVCELRNKTRAYVIIPDGLEESRKEALRMLGARNV